MPKIHVNRVTLAYETLGDGPPIVWTPGGWLPRDEWSYFYAGALANAYTVLLWDRRNSGASDLAVDEAASEFELWADDLHALLQALGLSPAYLAGGSAGSLFSLIMAQRYPADVKGLILIDSPTSELAQLKPILAARYLEFAEIAATRGMAAVSDYSTAAWMRMATAQAQAGDAFRTWIAASVAQNPGNHARLLAMDAQKFARQMEQWGELAMQWAARGRFAVAGLSDAQLGQITVPTLIAHGFDPLHPRAAAEMVYRRLPRAEWLEFSAHYAAEIVARAAASDTFWNQKSLLALPMIREFLRRVEAGAASDAQPDSPRR